MSTEVTTVDVIVVGMGAAGLAAAITASDAGATVQVIEKCPPDQAGGNSRVSGQVWFSPNDIDQGERHLHAMCGDYPVEPDTARAWAEEMSRNTEWVRKLAQDARGLVARDTDDPYQGDGTDLSHLLWGDLQRAMGFEHPLEYEYGDVEGHDCGSEYNVIGGTMGFSRLWLLLRSSLEARGIPVRYSTSVVGLLRDGDGVGGVVTESDGRKAQLFARKGVVLASGGFAANQEMTRNYLRLPKTTPWGSPACTGDGIKMAQGVGADLAHPYNYMATPGIAMPPYPCGEDAVPGGWRFINVGADGRRFVDETIPNRHGKSVQRGTFDFHPAVPMWTVFDERARESGPIVTPRQLFAVDWMKQIQGYQWSADNSVEIERGWIVRAGSLRELAEKLNIDANGLQEEVEHYNELAGGGRGDDRYGRPAGTMFPIATPPYYGYEWAQLLITTLGGVRKDSSARAVGPCGVPIDGLYCAGDVASTYTWCLSGGMSLGDAMAFGRIAGRHAATRGVGS